ITSTLPSERGSCTSTSSPGRSVSCPPGSPEKYSSTLSQKLGKLCLNGQLVLNVRSPASLVLRISKPTTTSSKRSRGVIATNGPLVLSINTRPPAGGGTINEPAILRSPSSMRLSSG